MFVALMTMKLGYAHQAGGSQTEGILVSDICSIFSFKTLKTVVGQNAVK